MDDDPQFDPSQSHIGSLGQILGKAATAAASGTKKKAVNGVGGKGDGTAEGKKSTKKPGYVHESVAAKMCADRIQYAWRRER